MKLNRLSQLILISAVALIAAGFLTACEIVTIDYVFVANSAGLSSGSAGQIDIFAADSETGALRTVHSAVASGGINPVSMVVTPNFLNLYVANEGSNNIVHFSIASDGELTQKDIMTLGSPGNEPVSIAVNGTGTRLYAVMARYPNKTPGAVLAIFPLDSSGTIGGPVANGSLSYWPLVLPGYPTDVLVPTGVNVLANNAAVYASVYDQSAYNPGGTPTSTANPGWVFGFAIGSGGGLSPTSSSPYQAGVKPTAITSDPTNRFVYATDYASNQLIGFTIQSASTLNFMFNGPFKTGNEPQAIVIDQRGKYLYVANALDSSVSAYAIDLPSGTPSAAVNVTGSATNSTDTQPVSITIDASLGRFVYTANQLGNSVSGFELNPNTGTLAPTINTPYPSGAAPMAVVSVPHGSHSTQAVSQ